MGTDHCGSGALGGGQSPPCHTPVLGESGGACTRHREGTTLSLASPGPSPDFRLCPVADIICNHEDRRFAKRSLTEPGEGLKDPPKPGIC